MLVELFANDRIEANLNPVGPLYYTGSYLICMRHAISEGGKLVLGSQAGRHGWLRCFGRPGTRVSGGLRRRRLI